MRGGRLREVVAKGGSTVVNNGVYLGVSQVFIDVVGNCFPFLYCFVALVSFVLRQLRVSQVFTPR